MMASALLMTAACDNTDSVFNFGKDLIEQSVSYDAAFAGSLSFTAPQEWTATSDSEWLAVEPDHGEAGAYTVELKLDRNTSTAPRTAHVKLVCGDESLTVSVTQTGAPENPEDAPYAPDRFVKSIVWGFESDYLPEHQRQDCESLFFSYDDQMRVTRIDENWLDLSGGYNGDTTCWVEFDYSGKEGSILMSFKPYYGATETSTAEASLGDGGFVTSISHGSEGVMFVEREGNKVKNVSVVYQSDKEIKQEFICITYDESGKMILWEEEGHEKSFEYSRNYTQPNINLDLNFLSLADPNSNPMSLFLLGLCGRFGNVMIEQRTSGMSHTIPSGYDDRTPGRHHYKGTFTDISEDAYCILEKDSRNCPSRIIWRQNVEEWSFEYDYVVSEDGSYAIDEDTRKQERTGNIIGHHDKFFEIEYMDSAQ